VKNHHWLGAGPREGGRGKLPQDLKAQGASQCPISLRSGGLMKSNSSNFAMQISRPWKSFVHFTRRGASSFSFAPGPLNLSAALIRWQVWCCQALIINFLSYNFVSNCIITFIFNLTKTSIFIRGVIEVTEHGYNKKQAQKLALHAFEGKDPARR